MIIPNKSLHRRTFLRGVGTALALPLLDAMVPSLGATRLRPSTSPVRLGFIYVPNGIIQKPWLPSDGGVWFPVCSHHEAVGAVPR